VSDRPGIIPFRYSSLCLAYTLCASIVFLFAPLGTQESSGSGPPESVSLFTMNGWSIVVVLGLPVLFALVPVLLRRSAHIRTLFVASAVLLTTFVFLGILSIGLYYLPSAGLMIAAAIREGPVRRTLPAGYRSDPIPPPSANGQGGS
jgi:asparagine N-glycosylation enzyme membrane subunit Stt3